MVVANPFSLNFSTYISRMKGSSSTMRMVRFVCVMELGGCFLTTRSFSGNAVCFERVCDAIRGAVCRFIDVAVGIAVERICRNLGDGILRFQFHGYRVLPRERYGICRKRIQAFVYDVDCKGVLECFYLLFPFGIARARTRFPELYKDERPHDSHNRKHHEY